MRPVQLNRLRPAPAVHRTVRTLGRFIDVTRKNELPYIHAGDIYRTHICLYLYTVEE
jgi:hypothetical protein